MLSTPVGNASLDCPYPCRADLVPPADGTCTSTIVDGIATRDACPKAWGYLLGTSCLCSLIEMGMAFVPPAKLKRIFPPIVTGLVVLLIGLSLIGESGFLKSVLAKLFRCHSAEACWTCSWAGGAGPCDQRPPNGTFSVCPQEGAPHALPWGSGAWWSSERCHPKCRHIWWHSAISRSRFPVVRDVSCRNQFPPPQRIDQLARDSIIIVELFGSPFMKVSVSEVRAQPRVLISTL